MSDEGRWACQDTLDEIAVERGRQLARWGTMNHQPLAWLSLLTEEMGEAAAYVNTFAVEPLSVSKICQDEYRKELVQIAALCVAAIESYDRSPLVGEQGERE